MTSENSEKSCQNCVFGTQLSGREPNLRLPSRISLNIDNPPKIKRECLNKIDTILLKRDRAVGTYEKCVKPKSYTSKEKYPFYHKFLHSNLLINGTDAQQEEMADYLALNAHSIIRLGDILGGRRKLKSQPSTEVKELVNSVINKTKIITEIRKEIENSSKK